MCWHSDSQSGDKAQYQRHGIFIARNGYAAFILDSIQIAETFGLHHGVFSQEMCDWYARGYTPVSVGGWNAMRADAGIRLLWRRGDDLVHRGGGFKGESCGSRHGDKRVFGKRAGEYAARALRLHVRDQFMDARHAASGGR